MQKPKSDFMVMSDNPHENFASIVKNLISALYLGYEYPVKIKGEKKCISAFMEALKAEKSYMAAYMNEGPGEPITYKEYVELCDAVEDFEKKTGIEWPIGQ